MQEIIDGKISELLTNSLVESPNGVMRLVYLSDLVETVGMITAEVTSVSASQLDKLQHNTIIATMVKLFKESQLVYTDPTTNELNTVNVLIFTKSISDTTVRASSIPDTSCHLYIFDKDALERNVSVHDLPKATSLILQGKVPMTTIPTVIVYSSGDTPDTENIDGNITVMSYVDMFYNFGTKYGFAIAAQTATDTQIYTVYDLPNSLSYSNKASTILNYVQDHIYFDTTDRASTVHAEYSDTDTPYPVELAKYLQKSFHKYIEGVMRSTPRDTVSELYDFQSQLRDLNTKIPTHITGASTTIQGISSPANDPTTILAPNTSDVTISTIEEVTDTIKQQLGGSNIHIENLTIHTLNVYTK